MNATIPDRGRLLTEQRNTASRQIDVMPIEQALRIMADEDAKAVVAVRTASADLAPVIESVVAGMRRGGRLVYVGAGTSGRLGVLDASECPPTFFTEPRQVVGVIAGGDAALRASSEAMEDDPEAAAAELNRLGIGQADTVVGIAAGGTTPYVLGAFTRAKQCGAVTAMLCCVERAKPAAVDHLVILRVGPEVITGSTRMKAGTATKLALNMISTVTMVCLGKTWGNLMVDLRATNSKLRDRAIRILCDQCQMSRRNAELILDQANGRVKLALVMARLDLDAVAAQRRIDEHEGRLYPLLGAPLE